MSSISEDVDDRLSTLPEDILSHILSLMPTKFAVRTSILSKRWRYSWMFVTNLDFGDIDTMDSLHSLTVIVDRVLKFCTASQVKLFRLRFPAICARNSSVSNWIDEAVRLKIKELDLQVHQLQLSPSMFSCKTLTKLRLHPSHYNRYNVWEFQCPIHLPCLKTLDIAVFADPFVNAFKLISGCPILESLSLEVTWRSDEKDYIFNIPTLKRLKLTWTKCATLIHKVILNTPNLEYLFVGGVLCSSFVVGDMSSLVEVCVSFYDIRFYHLWFELLKGITGVKSLSAENKTHLIDFNIPFASPLLVFPNMKHLELKGYWHSGLIPQFLERSPELKHLCIEKVVDSHFKKHEEYTWVKPTVVPACMLTKLTTIKFSMCERWKCDPSFLKYLLWKCDVPVLKYMLGNAEMLETVTITWENSSIEKETLSCAKLLKRLPRASSNMFANRVLETQSSCSSYLHHKTQKYKMDSKTLDVSLHNQYLKDVQRFSEQVESSKVEHSCP